MFNFLSDAVDFLRVGALIGEGPLGDDFSSVEVGVYPVDRDSVDLDSIGDRLLNCVGALEGRKERRMDVDYLPFVGLQKYVSDYSHIAGKADKFYLFSIKDLDYFFFIISLGGI